MLIGTVDCYHLMPLLLTLSLVVSHKVITKQKLLASFYLHTFQLIRVKFDMVLKQFIIIIIRFKGSIRDFLQSPHSAANCLRHVRSSGQGTIVCKSRATHTALITCKCHVTCHLVRRDSSAIRFDRVEIAFI